MAQRVVDAITALRAPFGHRLFHKEVRKECEETHVLCVQELLSRDAERFFDGIAQKFASCFRDHNRASFWPVAFRGSGLGVASQSTLLEPSVRAYSPGAGLDQFARKGTLHTRVALSSDLTVDVVNTHLQAGQESGAIAARKVQLQELQHLVSQAGSQERPFIICGDFNIDGLRPARESDEYRRLRSALGGFDDLGAHDDLATYEPHPERNTLAHTYEPFGAQQRIDYVFFRPAKGGRTKFEPTKMERILDRPLSAHGSANGLPSFASDHYGVSASFAYESGS